MLEVVKSSISFLTPIPVGGDIEVLRRNLWTFPFTAILIGLIVSIPHFTNTLFLSLLFYLVGEGINHIDGVVDFGDALFAPESRKKEALKDTATGTGGIVVVVLYLLTLHTTLQIVSVWQIVFAQVLAKYCMLLLMYISQPAWDGMAKYMMELIGKKDLLIGFLPLLPTAYLSGTWSVVALILSVLAVLSLRRYSHSKFGGVNGDVIGASNCIVFGLSLTILTVFPSISL